MRNSTVVKAIYNGNGVTRRWDIPFEYLDTSEIAVILTTVVDDINVEEHIPTSDYTIDISSNEVIYPSDLSVAPIEEGKKVTIHRVTDLLQKSDYTNQGALWPESVEASFDKIHQILHEQKESIDRSVKVDITGNDDPQQYFNEIIETAKLGLQKATEAIAAAENAATSETNAAASATAAAASAASMDESVATCTEKAAEAAASAASIDEAAQTATAKAAEAVSSATAAAGSATAAAGSAATAQASATSAAGSASAAATSETNATTAATSATTAKTAAETAASNAATSATAAAGSATVAANSVASIGDSVETAQQAAQDAQDAADSIGDAEQTCTTAAQNAATSATAAANSATSAEGSATSAANSADEVEDAKEEIIALAGGKFGFRQPNTTYAAEDMAFFGLHMSIWYLECITGGTTGSGDLVITNPQIDEIVTDGTVTWQVRKQSSTGTGTATTPGLTKLYSSTGNNTDGTMTQAAMTQALSGIGSDVSTLQTDVGALQTNVGGLQTSMTTAQGDIDMLEGDVGAAQSNISSLQGNMTTVQGNISTLQTSMTTAQTDITNLQNALSMTYKAKGSVAFANLPATLTSSMLGWVYNIYDDFTTDARFVEGAGNEYFAGENIAVVETTAEYVLTEDTEAVDGKTYYSDAQGTEVSPQPTAGDDISSAGYYEYHPAAYKFDVLSGYIDLSNYPRVVSFDATTGTLTLSTL